MAFKRHSYIAKKERDNIKKAIEQQINKEMLNRYEAETEQEKRDIFFQLVGLRSAIRVIEDLDKG